MASKPKQVEGRLYLGRDESGCEQYQWVGRFATVKERDEAVMRARLEREAEATTAKRPAGERVTCAEYADAYIERMESGALRTKSGRPFKASSIGTACGQLRHFKAEFGTHTLASIERHEAVQWAEKHDRKQGALQSVNTLFALAVDEELIARNPFRASCGSQKDAAPRHRRPTPSSRACSRRATFTTSTGRGSGPCCSSAPSRVSGPGRRWRSTGRTSICRRFA